MLNLRSAMERDRIRCWMRAEDIPTNPLILRSWTYPKSVLRRINRLIHKGVPAESAINALSSKRKKLVWSPAAAPAEHPWSQANKVFYELRDAHNPKIGD